MSLQSSLEAVE